MPTGQAIVNQALTTLGILEQGGTPSTSDSNAALAELNNMWQSWGIDEGLIFAEQAQQFAWAANAASNPIGPTATAPFNVALPQRIYGAWFIPASGQRIKVDLVNSERYHSHRDLTATAKSPDELYADWLVDPTAGTSTLYAWPVPNVAGTLELNTAATFTTWVLATNYNLPQAYADAINYALAFRLIPQFGVAVLPQVVQTVVPLAQKGELRIREMNRINRQIQLGGEMLEPPQEQQQQNKVA